MNKQHIIETVEQYVGPIMDQFHYELVDVEFVKEGPSYYLRVYIDKEGGVTIEDCSLTSKALEAILDEKDPIEVPYILEVSSPGLDRVLKKDRDFERFNGNVVDVKLYEAIHKQKMYQGELLEKTNEILRIKEEDGQERTFDMKNVAIVRLAILF